LEGENLRKINELLKTKSGVRNTQLFGDSLHVSFEQEPLQTDWTTWQNETDQMLKVWGKISPSIEDIFLNIEEERSE
jgi:hypothetical protein